MSRWNLAWLLGISTVALLGLSLTYSAPALETSLEQKHKNLKLLVDVLEDVQEKYVKQLDQDKMRDLVETMINSGLEHLDPHSAFYNAEEKKSFEISSKGKFGGIGVRIGVDPRTGQIMVESPMVGAPAYDAGVMAGDIIVKIEGKSTENMPLKKIVEMIQGDPDTPVKFSVVHEGEKMPVDISIMRKIINVESVMGDQHSKTNLKDWDFWIDPISKIAYVRITDFKETTVGEMTKVVDALQKMGMRGLVVDLRNNPGGLLTAAVGVSSLFLPEGETVVTTKGRENIKQEEFQVHHEDPNFKPGNYPLVILINRFSASASEIVAAALQDHLRAIIVGERSYGKGSVQNVLAMENRTSMLKLTTASYWRPSGKNIHRFPDSKEEDEWGVKPNPGFDVKLSDDERAQYFRWRRDRDIVRRPGQVTKNDGAKEQADAIAKLKGVQESVAKALEALTGAGPAAGAKLTPLDAQGITKTLEDTEKAALEARRAVLITSEFHDRVLEKALDYIRESLAKAPKAAAAVDAVK